MKILITGGCGYIGSILTEVLLTTTKHEITVLDNLRFKQSPLLNLCYHKNLNVIIGDCREPSVIKPLLSANDCIIHLAAIVGVDACDRNPFDARTLNFDATQNIVRSLSKDQILLSPCSNSGYGVGQSGIYCTEETPLNPISLYGTTKVEAEKVVMSRENSISFRLATVFGGSSCLRTELLVNDFVRKALFDKSIVLFEKHFKRNFIHIRDVISAFLLGLNKFDEMKSQVYNVGLSSANLSKLELCELIKKYIDFEIICCDIRKDPDQRNYIVSNEKIERYGFVPQYTVDDGILELIKIYKIRNSSYYNN